MADNSMAFMDWIAQQGGEDFLRSLVETVLARLMDFEVTGIAGAGLFEPAPHRPLRREGVPALRPPLRPVPWSPHPTARCGGKVFPPYGLLSGPCHGEYG